MANWQLQALAAEDMDMKPRIAKSGAIGPLVGMVKSGTHPVCSCIPKFTQQSHTVRKIPHFNSSAETKQCLLVNLLPPLCGNCMQAACQSMATLQLL